MTESEEQLIQAAKHARGCAHAPYSGYCVGAAVLDEQGRIASGCNVENAAYPLGQCAEANAIGRMICQGGRQIANILILGGRQELELCMPCGGCRQRIQEFANTDTRITLLDRSGKLHSYSMQELLPFPFSLSHG